MPNSREIKQEQIEWFAIANYRREKV